jgi:hypothetical protein
VQTAFKEKMGISSVPLLSDLRLYLESLPQRGMGKDALRLHTLPFYAREQDLKGMARQLVKPKQKNGQVMYIAAPSQSGKTAAVLPAFLYAVETSVVTHDL